MPGSTRIDALSAAVSTKTRAWGVLIANVPPEGMATITLVVNTFGICLLHSDDTSNVLVPSGVPGVTIPVPLRGC